MTSPIGEVRLVLPAARPTALETEHFQGSAAGVDLVAMGKIGEPFEDAGEVLVPAASQDLHVAGEALPTERPEPLAG